MAPPRTIHIPLLRYMLQYASGASMARGVPNRAELPCAERVVRRPAGSQRLTQSVDGADMEFIECPQLHATSRLAGALLR